MPRVFIIGDIHGCCKTFTKLLTDVIALRKSDKIYCLGDYIDRGPNSKGVIDFILHLRNSGYSLHTLRGNHEQLLLNSESNPRIKELWLNNGGDKALQSFGAKSILDLDKKYRNFFRRTKHFIQTKHFILAHAGLNFAAPNPLTDKEVMLWIRNFPVDLNYLNGKILIHGHTPKSREFILSQPFQSPVNLDGGCVYKGREGMGSLFALNFNERTFLEVENID
ncbi:metallophosphoesterase family protein [Bacteroidota bacterium]